MTYPLDLAKTRMQVHGCVNPVIEKRGFFKTTAFVVKEEGVLKLWQGLTPAVYRHLSKKSNVFQPASEIAHFMA